MAQQQLLLVILVTIIVGISTVIAINVFGNSNEAANYDATRVDMLSIGTLSQGYFNKPSALGGGNRSYANITFNTIPFSTDSVSSNGLTAINGNSVFIISNRTSASFTLSTHPISSILGMPNLSSTGSNPMSFTVSQGDITWVDNQ